MPDPMTSPTDTRRVPGWERVLDAFMADPDRILTNVQLGQIPGVQAFHQRISDLTHYGYVLTSAVQLKPGYYAYALLGVSASATWTRRRPRPHADALPTVSDDFDAYAATVKAAVDRIEAQKDALLKRGRAPVADTRRALVDAAAYLDGALGENIVGEWGVADRRDVLALARAAAHELGRADALRATTNGMLARLREAGGEDATDLNGDALIELACAALRRPKTWSEIAARRRAPDHGPVR